MSNGAHTFGFPLALANTSGVQPQIEKGTGNPNGVLVRPIGSLFLRTDTAQLWQNTNGISTWTQAAGGSGGSVPNPTPNDYSIELGATSDMALGYYLAATTGLPFDVVALGATTPVALTFNANFLPGLRLSTNNADHTGGGAGATGSVFIQSGEASANAGAAGGETGSVFISTGAFLDGAGAGGQSGDVNVNTGATDSSDSGDVLVFTGDSTSARTGSLSLTTGNAGTNAGSIFLTAGDGGLLGGSIQISAGVSGSGAGGNIQLEPGTGTTSPGAILFDGGIRPSPSNDTTNYNAPLAYGIYKSRTYLSGTGPGSVTRQYVPNFFGEIEMILVRNASVGIGDTLAVTINGTNVFAPGGVAGPLTQAGGTFIGGDQFLPRLNTSGTLFSAGDTIQVAYNAAGASGGAMVSIFVRRRT